VKVVVEVVVEVEVEVEVEVLGEREEGGVYGWMGMI